MAKKQFSTVLHLLRTRIEDWPKEKEIFDYRIFGPTSLQDEPHVTVILYLDHYMKKTREFTVSLEDGYVTEIQQ